MDICIFGAGAIGGFMAALLARAGASVKVIARGPRLEAIRNKGLTLDCAGERFTVEIPASDNPADFGPQDYVMLTAKTTGLAAIAPQLGPLLGENTTVVSAQNGIPWWFFHGFQGHEDKRIECVDPQGAIDGLIPAERVLGCVLHIGCSVPEPGLVVHAAQNRFIVGEPDGSESARATSLVEVMAGAGIGAELTRTIQQETWIKLLGNMTMAPISVLTGATNDEIAGDPGICQLCIDMMEEAGAVGRAYELEPGMPSDERVALGGQLVGFKTSMYQDFAAGRPLELDAIVASVIAMGRMVEVPTPLIDTVYALAAQKGRLAGVY